ncbi:MAG: VWA domain-containing protein [Erysipelotrichaceae bacterium]|nr:VWA domain-containing protein [Erysipelotrichaceae bacterium]
MKNIVKNYLNGKKDRQAKRRKTLAILITLAVMVGTATTWQLHRTGISMARTADTLCGQEEHVHDDSCYEYDCGLEEHHHTDECYTEKKVLTCTNTDPDHVHDDSCYTTEKVLTCQKQEHTHNDSCPKKLICGKTEHQHTADCYEASDPDKGPENGKLWKKAADDVKRSGIWTTDLVNIAKSQIGYRECDQTFQIRDGMKNCYTLYAAEAGSEYIGNWNSVFAAWVINQTGINAGKAEGEEILPTRYSSGAEGWMTELGKQKKFTSIDSIKDWSTIAGETGEKLAGSFLFYEPEKTPEESSKTDSSQTAASSAGKVRVSLITKASITEDEMVIETIEGDVNGEVKEIRYDLANDQTQPVIRGFLLVPEQPDKPETDPDDDKPVPVSPEEKEEEKKDDQSDSDEPGVMPAAEGDSRSVTVTATFDEAPSSVTSFKVTASNTTTFTLNKSSSWSTTSTTTAEDLRPFTADLDGYTMGTVSKTTNTSVTQLKTIGDGIIKNSNNQYLVLKSGGSIGTTTDAAQATVWTYSNSKFSAKSGYTTYYLTYSSSSFGTNTSASTRSWSMNNSNQLRYKNSSSTSSWTNTSATLWTTTQMDTYTIPFTKKAEVVKDVKVTAVWPEGGKGIPDSLAVTANDKAASTFTLNDGNGWTEQKSVTYPDGASSLTLKVPAVDNYSHVIKMTTEGAVDVYTIYFQYEGEYPIPDPGPLYPDLARHKTIDSFRDGVPNADTSLSTRTDIDLSDFYRLYLGVSGTKPINVLFVIDRSGSMGKNNKLVNLKKAVTGKDDTSGTKCVVDMIMANPDNMIAMTSFSSKDYDSKHVEQTWTQDADTMKTAVNSIAANGGTNYMQALNRAQTLLENLPKDRQDYDTYMLFLTDGLPTFYINSSGGESGDGQETSKNLLDNEVMEKSEFDMKVFKAMFEDSMNLKILTVAYGYTDSDYDTRIPGTDKHPNDGTDAYTNTSLLQNFATDQNMFAYTDTKLKEVLKKFFDHQITKMVIEDQLSDFVDLAEQPDFKVTVYDPANPSDKTVLWDSSGITGAGRNYLKENGVYYDAATRTVKCELLESHIVTNKEMFELSFNVKANDTAYQTYANTPESSLHTGDQETDYGSNQTSSGCKGLYSNKVATATCTVGTTDNVRYGLKRPVVQISPMEILLKKRDKYKEDSYLAGAKFDLYRIESGGDVLIDSITTDENGTFQMTRLVPGEYKLIETEPPEGYTILTEPIEFTLGRTDAGKDTFTIPDTETRVEITNTGTGFRTDKTMTVKNEQGYRFPETGGSGVFGIYGTGSILIAGALVILLGRKLNADQE